ncbi:alpha/beta fold hydrolase [Rhodothalassium salexigens]|uniref:alpha/beta fold hydrolase n=1 Tax=Rhodothalassium salexigens TaxID=1086 RepID=UPI001913554A|nr:alpha/beta fold hydrolase [Rhodothalassium salexigens]
MHLNLHRHMPDDPTARARCPAIILHGLFGQARNWQALAKRLAVDRPVLVPDLRNHGRSPHDATMDYATMAGDIAHLIERTVPDLASAPDHQPRDLRSPGRAAVIGHSMGGKVAAALALTRPDLVARLMVLDIAPVTYGGRGFEVYIDAMRALPLDRIASRQEADANLARAIPDRPIRAFLMLNLSLAGGGARWRPDLDAIRAALPAIYGFPELSTLGGQPYEGPTLVLSGDRSDYVQPKHRDTIRTLFPAARLASLKEAGHWLHADQPEAFLSAARQFLAADETTASLTP